MSLCINPLRAKLVDSLSELRRYPWSGHAVLMGKVKRQWQDDGYVLAWFGHKVGESRREHRQYMAEGISQGRRPDLVGGGLIRFQGGWSAVKTMRRLGIVQRGDKRILGSGEFVETMMKQADEKVGCQFSSEEQVNRAVQLIERVCRQKQLSVEALQAGSRIREVARVRSQLAEKLVKEYGLSLVETARHLGVTTAAIVNSPRRQEI